MAEACMEGMLTIAKSKDTSFFNFGGEIQKLCRIKGNQLEVYDTKSSPNPSSLYPLCRSAVTDLPGKKFELSGKLIVKPVILEASTPQLKTEWVNALRKAARTAVNIGDFELLRQVGEGAFGVVFKVKHREMGGIYALKVVDKDKLLNEQDVASVRDEALLLQRIQYPFIVRMHCCFQTNDKLYILMDYLPGGEAFFLMQKRVFTEEAVRLYTAQIALGLHYLHSHEILYRDLKPENCVLDASGNMVLTDFGLSKRVNSKTLRRGSKVGTPAYWAPEMIRGDSYSKAIDYWALGCLIFELITSLHPFRESGGVVSEISACEKEPNLECDTAVSKECKHIVMRFLDKDPETRLQTLDKIKEEPWFAGYDWAKVENKEIPPPYIPDPDDSFNFAPEFVSQKPLLRPSATRAHIVGFDWEATDSPFYAPTNPKAATSP